ncbi:DUF6541 family protein [Amycolatopsis alkalitolerans]|uniref:Copper-transporting ATPase n=1 Tax=Amycolatopsis alkalitolerans TaxID=2547244 RepID=A0A5C4M301_9PSEU|nr:DUF6541 family protein [Amycolatopsis alkalitolerans]TNC27430.1 hypothetical protein FG385_10210 [Amycolatopsis alkalitolerans]
MLTIAAYLLVIFGPGAVIAALAGARGWLLAGMAPLLTYCVAGLAGPWFATIGVPFNLPSFLVATLVFAGIAFAVRRPAPGEHHWDWRGHTAVAVSTLFAATIGARTLLRGMGELSAIPQGFDAVYHADGIRYIAETGDGSLTGMGTLNWYPHGLFYPNAYHLVASLVERLTGAPIPVVLNANTLLLPGLLALSLVVLVRRFHGRAVLAGAVALVCVAAATLLYDSLGGPLLPFVLGLALTPLGTVALREYLRRPGLDTGFLLAASMIGLLTIHSSTLFAGLLFALPLLANRAIGRNLLRLLPIAAVSLVAAWLQLSGAIGLASGSLPYNGWPTETTTNKAVGILLAFQRTEPHAQLWLSAALLIGLIAWRGLGELRWITASAVLLGLFAVAVLSSGNPLVKALSRPWWNDPTRMVAMAAIPLCVLAAHGLAEVQRVVRDRFTMRWFAPATAVVVLAGFFVVSNQLYTTANAAIIQPGYGPHDGIAEDDLPVSHDEEQAMLELGRLAKPGQWAMNDRADGSVWTYALTGVRTVAAHFDRALPTPEYTLLAAHFRDYDTNPQVRATVARLNIRWVILGRGGFPTGPHPPGLLNLDGLPFLRVAYRNADATVYQLLPGR